MTFDFIRCMHYSLHLTISHAYRTIRIGRPCYPCYPDVGLFGTEKLDFVYQNYVGPFPFTELNSFECYHRPCSPYIVRLLQQCKKLCNLVLAWNDQKPFPEMELLSRVHTLRLYLAVDVRRREYVNHPVFSRPTYKHITTLVLLNPCNHSAVISQCMNLRFPNLRVFRLESRCTSVPVVYNFIQCHPTILEATIHFSSFDNQSLRIEALLKLINGTGTWIAPTEDPDVVVDQPSATELDENNPVPPPLPHKYGPFYRFSFTRAPRTPTALQWKSQRGSQHPRYRCTGFAIYSVEHDEQGEWGTTMNFLRNMRTTLPHLEELRLATKAGATECEDFTHFIVS